MKRSENEKVKILHRGNDNTDHINIYRNSHNNFGNENRFLILVDENLKVHHIKLYHIYLVGDSIVSKKEIFYFIENDSKKDKLVLLVDSKVKAKVSDLKHLKDYDFLLKELSKNLLRKICSEINNKDTHHL